MQKREILGWVGVYGFWAITIALGIVNFLVSRQTVGIVMEVAGSDELARTAIDRFFLFIVAILVIVLIVFVEYYYRVGFDKGLLLKRTARVIGIELLVLAVLHMIPQVLLGLYDSWVHRLVILGEMAGGFALIAASVRLKQGPRRPTQFD